MFTVIKTKSPFCLHVCNHLRSPGPTLRSLFKQLGSVAAISKLSQVVVHTFNRSTWEAEPSGSLSLRSTWSTVSSRTGTTQRNLVGGSGDKLHCVLSLLYLGF